jgi:hypothetical protein
LSLGAIALRHAIGSHNDYLILCISNCKKKKKTTNGLVFIQFYLQYVGILIQKKLESI